MMSSQLSSIAPLCQAALLTFNPSTLFLQSLLSLVIFILVLKVFASVAKVCINQKYLVTESTSSAVLSRLTSQHKLDDQPIFILKQPELVAFTFAFPFLPKNGIFLSSGLLKNLPPKEIEAVLLHEIYHWQQGHPFLHLVLSILTPTLFFIPIFKDIIENWQLQSEIHADQFAIRTQDTNVHLKRALSKWLDSEELAPAWAKSFSDSSFELRIAALQGQKHNPLFSKKRFLLSAFVLASIVFFAQGIGQEVQATITIPAMMSQAPQCQPTDQLPQSSVHSVMSISE